MSKRGHRRKTDARPSIMACQYCGEAFAKEMQGGVFCNQVCRWEFLREEREGREHEVPTVGDLIDQLQNDQQG